MALVTKRFDIFLVNLDPTLGHEICTVDRLRLVKHLGKLDAPTASRVLTVQSQLFAR